MHGSSIVFLEVFSIQQFPWECSWLVKYPQPGRDFGAHLSLTESALLATIAQIIASIVAAAMADALLPGPLLVDTKLGGTYSN